MRPRTRPRDGSRPASSRPTTPAWTRRSHSSTVRTARSSSSVTALATPATPWCGWPSTSAPVLTTFKAKGLVPDTHPLGAGVLGRSGTPVASWLMNESDLVIAVGLSFSNHTGVADYKPIVQIDDTPEALGRFHPVRVPVLGDADVTTRLLIDATASKGAGQRDDVASRWSIWRAEKARRSAEDRGHGVNACAVFEALSRHLPENAVVAVDVGNHA